MTITRRGVAQVLAQTVEHNGVVHVAGLTADDLSQGMREQTAVVLKKIDAALAAAGTDKSKLLTAMIYLSDMSRKSEMNDAWMAWIDPDNKPTRATVGTVLGSPDTLVEIVVSAAK
jgi:enamine deaminase RidA (YjgF/YER057c/UK114 family)